MDKLDRLLEIAGEADAEEIRVLRNACASCLKAYDVEATAANKRNLDAARGGLAEAVERMWPVYFPGDEKYRNLLEVLKYLKGQGYKIGKSKLYKDRSNKQIRVQADGAVRKKDADAYAKTLTLLGDPLKGLEALQNEKARLEKERLQHQVAALEYEEKLREGTYVLR